MLFDFRIISRHSYQPIVEFLIALKLMNVFRTQICSALSVLLPSGYSRASGLRLGRCNQYCMSMRGAGRSGMRSCARRQRRNVSGWNQVLCHSG